MSFRLSSGSGVPAYLQREHFIAPVTSQLPINLSSASGPLAHAWWIAGYILSPSGHSAETGIAIPAACQVTQYTRFEACLSAHGYHRSVLAAGGSGRTRRPLQPSGWALTSSRWQVTTPRAGRRP
jgi:hypothetical protein